MGEKSDYLNKCADDLYAEAEDLEEEAKELKRRGDEIGLQADAAEKLSPEEDRKWAEMYAAQNDRRQMDLEKWLKNHARPR